MSGMSSSTRANDYGVYWHSFVIVVITLSLYVHSMSSHLGLEDDGLFVLSAYFNGISHPPGYPLHSLFAHLFTLLPFGSIPFRVHLLSAVFASVTAVLLWHLILQLTRQVMAAYVAALMLAFSAVFWSQAIIAEVYTLNSLFIVLLMLFALQVERSVTHRRAWLMALSLVYGLALTNHWPLVILSSLGIVIVLLPVWRQVLRDLPYCVLPLLLGLSPYLWMYLHSQSDPFVAFYGPIEGWREFWFYVSRQGYADMDNSVAAGLADKWGLITFFAAELPRQVGWLGFLLAAVGFLSQFRIIGHRWSWALIAIFLTNSVLLIAILGFEYDEFYTAVFRVYPLSAYLVLAIWGGLGFLWLWRCASQYASIRLAGWVQGLVLAVIILSVVLTNYSDNLRADDQWAELYGHAVLSGLDHNAIVVADDDVSFSVLAYLRYVQGVRSDVEVFNTKGFVLNNRVFRPYRLSVEEEHRRWLDFVMSLDRPIYMIDDELRGFAFHDYLIYKRLRPTWKYDQSDVSLNAGPLRYLSLIAQMPTPSDEWSRMHRNLLLSDALPKLMRYDLTEGQGEYVTQMRMIIDAAQQTFDGQVARMGAMLRMSDAYGPEELLSAENDMTQRYHSMARKGVRARYFMYKGELAIRLNADQAVADQYYWQARDVWPHPDNPVNKKLGLD